MALPSISVQASGSSLPLELGTTCEPHGKHNYEVRSASEMGASSSSAPCPASPDSEPTLQNAVRAAFQIPSPAGIPAPVPEKGWMPPAPTPVTTYKTPKHTFLTLVKAGMAKGEMTWYNTFIMAVASGIFIGFGGLFSITVAGGLAPAGALLGPAVPKLIGGAVFPIALFLIIITGGELFTGNLMLLSVAVMSGKTTFYSLFRNWFIVYIGNFTGCVIMAYFGTFLPSMIDNDPYQVYLQNVVRLKMTLGWGTVFLRGIGANWLVCLAVFLGVASESFEGKIIGMWWPIAAFATIGYEHCIANMYYIMTGLMYGAPFTFGEFLSKNLIPATLGNMIAAIIFMACVYYYVYRDFAMPALDALRLRNAIHRHLPHGVPHMQSLPFHIPGLGHRHHHHPADNAAAAAPTTATTAISNGLHHRQSHTVGAAGTGQAVPSDSRKAGLHAAANGHGTSTSDHVAVKIHEANV